MFGHVAAAGEEVVGVALWFRAFSTWDGVHGIYLEDLFVRADHRRIGHGSALLAELAAECVRQGYTRLEWSVLRCPDWARHTSEQLGKRRGDHNRATRVVTVGQRGGMAG